MVNVACRAGDEICIPKKDTTRIVIIGGGFAGLELAKKLRKESVQIVLLDKNNFHQFQPLLYQVATSALEPDNIIFPIRKIFKEQENLIFKYAEVEKVNPDEKIVYTSIGKLEYDILVIATGTNTNFFGLNDVKEYSLGMKTIQEALDIRSLILQNLENAASVCDELEEEALSNFIIVGGGPAGVEMAGALAEFKEHIIPKDYPELDVSQISIYLIEALDKLLASMSKEASDTALEYLKDMGVKVLLGSQVSSYDGTTVYVKPDLEILSKTVIWTAGVIGNTPQGFTEESVGKGGRLIVDEFNRVQPYSDIYAIGDIALMRTKNYPNGHPMVAQVAIQQGKLLADNILKAVNKQPQIRFSYEDKGAMATIGRKKAVADLNQFKFRGFLAWLLWSLVHLVSISGFRNRLLVGLNWVWNYLTHDKGDRLIIRKYTGGQQ